MVHVAAILTVAKAKQAEVLGLVAELVRETRREDGCLQYVFTCGDADRCIFVEQWASLPCLFAHSKSPHYKRLAKRMFSITKVCCVVLLLPLFVCAFLMCVCAGVFALLHRLRPRSSHACVCFCFVR